MYTYIGCFQDRTKRLFPVGPYTNWNNEMSTSICFNYCSSKSYQYFATEYRNQCFCGNGEKLNSSQYLSKNETDCNMPCIGHVKQICGGSWRASVYKINHNGQNVSTTYHTPTSQKQITSDKGCYVYLNSQDITLSCNDIIIYNCMSINKLPITKPTTSPKPSTSNSDNMDKGIGVGIAVVLLLIIVAVISCLFWKRRKQKIHIKDSSMMDHVYDRNQNITTSDSSSIELHVYENGHPYGNSNSKITTRISNGCIEPQTCNTTMDNKPKTDYGHAHMKLDKRSIMKNILPSLFHNYFKLGNEKTDQEAGNQIADVSQTELDLTAGGSNGAYATLDSTETGFSKGKRVFPNNKENSDQTKLEKTNHVIKGKGDYCCVEGEYNTLNKIRRFSNHGSLYSQADDGVYDISGNNNRSKTTDNTYDHFFGNQTVIAADYDNVIKY